MCCAPYLALLDGILDPLFYVGKVRGALALIEEFPRHACSFVLSEGDVPLSSLRKTNMRP